MRPAIFLILLSAILVPGLLLTGCSSPGEEPVGDTKSMGIMVPDSGVVAIGGKMAFYWKRFLQPSDFDGGSSPEISAIVPFPDTWNGFKVDGAVLPGKGYATYRTSFFVDSVRAMAIRMEDYCNTFKLWVNGQLIAQGGIPGTNEVTNHAVKVNVLEGFKPLKGTNELILQTANFEEKYGGFRQPILVGDESKIRRKAAREKTINAFALGLILMMAVYHLALFWMNRNRKAFLWFGLMAFFIALRFWLLSDVSALEPWLQEHVHFYLKLAIASAVLTSLTLFFFYHSVFPEWLGIKIRNLYGVIALVMSFLIFVLPIYEVSVGIHYLQGVVIAGLVYILYLTARSLFSESRHKKWMNAAGILLFLFSVIWEGMIFNRAVYSEYILHYGLLGFIFFQSFALSYDFSRTHRRNEDLKYALAEHNKNSKQEVEEKSRELIETKERELLSVTMQKSSTDKLLKSLEKRLCMISESYEEGPGDLNEMIHMIRNSRSSDEHDKILMHFEKVYPDFFTILTELHPLLNQREQKLCAYLKMNLENKEIADLLHVAPESVRKAKTRMRKKMGLSSDRDIYDYLIRI